MKRKPQLSKKLRKKKRPKFVQQAGPGSSQRFCLNCNEMRTFRYSQIVGHSECTFCGGRIAKAKKEEEK